MTYKEIQELNAVEPFCFEDNTQEQWYKCGLAEGAKIGYEQAEKDFIEKAEKWLKSCLDNGCWVANNLCDYDKQGIVQGFKEMMYDKHLFLIKD